MSIVTPRAAARRAFTLIELLVAIGVVILLVAITLTVGPSVLEGRRVAAAEQLIGALDGMLETYIQENQGRVPTDNTTSYMEAWDAVLNANTSSEVLRAGAFYGSRNDIKQGDDADINPVYTDQQTGVDYPVRPSSAMFFLQAEGLEPIDNALGRMPPSKLAQFFGEDVRLTAALDVWGDARRPYERHVLYVHPANARAQQLYGYCRNGRPYFLSAGPDGVYGSIHDLSFGRRKAMRKNSGEFNTAERVVEFFRKAQADNITSYEVGPATVADDAAIQQNPEL